MAPKRMFEGCELARDGPKKTKMEEEEETDQCEKKNEDSWCGIEKGIISNPNPCVSKKKLIVLDLNGLLADIVPSLEGYTPDIVIGYRAIFKRPFYQDFLNFCFQKFEVGIWSSRKRSNVEKITDFLLGDLKSKLLFSWDMSYCVTTTFGSLENNYKNVVFKDLNKLWEKHGDYNETNTVLLDDSPYKALLNPVSFFLNVLFVSYIGTTIVSLIELFGDEPFEFLLPYTAIFPHSYKHQNKTDTSLGSDGDLRLHLEKLAEAENVQEFIKKNPFGQEAITEASESWEFYRGVMRAHQYAI